MSNLILGYGLLGKELVKQTGWRYVCKEEGFDLLTADLQNKLITYSKDKNTGDVVKTVPKVIINCIGNTDTYSKDRQSHWDINYAAPANLVDFCNKFKIKLVHISTSYIYANSVENACEEDIPVHGGNWYSYTKLLADGYIQLKSNNYLLIRCAHKPYPFPYERGWIDQVGNVDYVNAIAEIIVKLINKDCTGVYNVGTELKTIYDLATKTNKKVEPMLKPKYAPGNITMDLTKLNKEL